MVKEIKVTDHTGERIKQNCGDYLVIDRKSQTKIGNRYLWEGHFEGYHKNYLFMYNLVKDKHLLNKEKPDKYGFLCDCEHVDSNIYFIWKNMERRCYYMNNNNFKIYGKKGITVNENFKVYSKFKDWYEQHLYNEPNLQIDKDCACQNEYGPNTCILIPNDINTFISTLGKGIYTTKDETYCVRLRRKYKRLNRNFKDLNEAIAFKKEEDLHYLNILFLEHPNIPNNIKDKLINYVKVFEYPNRFPRNS